jgi:hypothetical protein
VLTRAPGGVSFADVVDHAFSGPCFRPAGAEGPGEIEVGAVYGRQLISRNRRLFWLSPDRPDAIRISPNELPFVALLYLVDQVPVLVVREDPGRTPETFLIDTARSVRSSARSRSVEVRRQAVRVTGEAVESVSGPMRQGP